MTSNSTESAKSVAFFAPHSAIWSSAFPQALIAESLQSQGFKVRYVTCDGEFSKYCICMRANGVVQESPDFKKRRICAICKNNRNAIAARFDFEHTELGSFLAQSDFNEAKRQVLTLTKEDFQDLTFEGTALGRVAPYEFLLQYKKRDLRVSDQEFRKIKIAIYNAFLSATAFCNFLKQGMPAAIVTYNTYYSVNGAWHRLAQARGIPSYFLNGGAGLGSYDKRVILARGTMFEFITGLRSRWPRYANSPASAEGLEEITKHIRVTTGGSSVFAYSSAINAKSFDIRTYFGIREEQKILVAATSSFDEIFAAAVSDSVNSISEAPDQLQWIKRTIEFAKGRPDIFLIIRIHPREFPNKREGELSETAKLYQSEFNNLPSNIRVNWPADNVSIYDLAQHMDVLLNYASSVGKELALLGIPVVLCSPDAVYYSPDINYVATSDSEYVEMIEFALSEPLNMEMVKNAYRWCAYEFYLATLDISDGFSPQKASDSYMHLKSRLARRAIGIFRNDKASEMQCSSHITPLRQSETIAELIRMGAAMPLDLKSPIEPSRELRERETVELLHQIGEIQKMVISKDSLKPTLLSKRMGAIRQHLLEEYENKGRDSLGAIVGGKDSAEKIFSL